MKKYGTSLLIIFFSSLAIGAPASLTYQGRILKSDGTPLEYNNVSFIFQITDPTGSCILYEEQVTGYSMVNSGGVFDTAIGLGTRSFPTGGGTFTVLDSLKNVGTLACQGSSTYSPAIDDGRRLRVQFHDGTGWKTVTPDNIIRSVPYAGYAASAAKLGSNVVGDFVLKAGLPTCGVGTFLSWDGTALSCAGVSGASGGTVTDVSSANNYISVANGSTAAVLTLNVGTIANTVAAGNDSRIVNSLQQSQFPSSCAANQTLTFSSPSGAFTCSNIAIAGSQVTGAIAGNAAGFTGALAGDVSGTQGATVVDKIKGVAVSATAPTSGDVLKYNGTTWAPTAIPAGTVTGVSSTNNYLSVANGTNAASLTVNVGTVANTVAAGDDTRIVNAIRNAGGVTKISAGLDAGKSALSAVGEVYFATDTQKIYRHNGATLDIVASVDTSGGGTVTSVSSANGDIVVTNGTTTPSLALNSGTGNNQILKLDGTAKIPAVDGSQVTNLNPANLSTVVPVNKGGTGQSSYTDGQILIGNSTGNTLSKQTLSGDVAMTNAGLTTVNGVKGKSVSAAPTATGQVLRYDGTNWTPNFVSMFDLRSTVTGTTAFASGCTAGQTLTWTAATDNLTCTNISITGSAFGSQTQNLVLAAPNGSAGNPSFRALVAADLPAGVATQWLTNSSDIYYNTGKVGIGTATPTNMLSLRSPSGTAGSIGIYNSDFVLSTAGSALALTLVGSSGNTASLIQSYNTGATVGGVLALNGGGGNVGVGTSVPRAVLDVNGTITGKPATLNATANIDFSTGNMQYTASSCGAFTLNNMKDGGSYSFVLQGATSATCSFTAYSGSGTTGPLTVHLPPDHTATVASTHTMYNFMVFGTHVYVSWIPMY